MLDNMKRNGKIFLVVFTIVVIIYILLHRQKPRNDAEYHYRKLQEGRERHPVSYFQKQVLSNDTLFKEATLHSFYHKEARKIFEHYLRPGIEQPASSFKPKEQNIQSDFNIDNDVIVYLHIQKVGGTKFNRHLVEDMQLDKPCMCKDDVVTSPCYCKNKNDNVWLFSWFTIGWPCGLHADWTMLHECVDQAMDEIEGRHRKRRYFYVTLLRDPISRYLSEWKHLRQGQHWNDVKLRCDQKDVSYMDVIPCFPTSTWVGVYFDEFMDCKDNMATNRQTRMLADLTKSHCYLKNKLKRANRYLAQLESATENLETMTFFGITEFQTKTQRLFEHTFNVKFNVQFTVLDDDESDELITRDEFISMMKYIEMDVILYHRAKLLFTERVKQIANP